MMLSPERPPASGALAVRPRHGDVLVSQPHDPSGGCTVRQVPVSAQLRFGSRNEAVAVARRFARTHAVDIWFGEEAGLRLLEVYRRLDDIRAAVAIKGGRS